jgi:UDP-N-acetylglucosamine 2-epimerase (non-hydrolysing)
LREETERPITVESGTNKVIGVNKNIIDEINDSLNTKLQSYNKIELWDGKTSERIYQELNIE